MLFNDYIADIKFIWPCLFDLVQNDDCSFLTDIVIKELGIGSFFWGLQVYWPKT